LLTSGANNGGRGSDSVFDSVREITTNLQCE